MDTEATPTDKTYTVLSGGENTFDISRRLKIPTAELMEHNSLTSYYVAEGTILHLPYAREEPAPELLVTELWDTPALYHVNKTEGAKKYSFGGAKTWTDIQPYGVTHPKYRELRIVGLATLTFAPDRIYQYYLHDIDVTDGKAKPCGFPTEFFAYGEAPTVPETRHSSVADIEALLADVEPVVPVPSEITPEDDSADAPAVSPTLWKSTYQPLPDGPEAYVIVRNVVIQELDGRRWERTLKAGSQYTIGGTVMKDGHEYAVPEVPKKQEGLYYGIPWNSTTLIKAADYARMTATIDTKDGEKYEVTKVSENRQKVYEDALFKPFIKQVAKTHVKVVDGWKKLNKKEKV